MPRYSLLFMRMRQEVLILFSRSPIPRIVYYRMSTIEQNTGNAQADKKECLMQEKKLEMYGGLFGGLIPLIVLVGGLVWLSVAERGGTKPFWACAWIALCVGIFFAKNKEEYCGKRRRKHMKGSRMSLPTQMAIGCGDRFRIFCIKI